MVIDIQSHNEAWPLSRFVQDTAWMRVNDEPAAKTGESEWVWINWNPAHPEMTYFTVELHNIDFVLYPFLTFDEAAEFYNRNYCK